MSVELFSEKASDFQIISEHEEAARCYERALVLREQAIDELQLADKQLSKCSSAFHRAEQQYVEACDKLIKIRNKHDKIMAKFNHADEV